MVLHLVPEGYLANQIDQEQEEIRLTEARPRPPLLRDWIAENEQQIITHTPTGCQFRAYPLEIPMAGGIVTPFGRRYEIAVKLVGMNHGAPRPTHEQIVELGRQGIEWIQTFTFEARRKQK